MPATAGSPPEGHFISQAPNLFVFPGFERAYGPDVYAAHEQTLETVSNHLDGEALSFVAELTSSATRDEDLSDKVETCAKAGVPVYLILDMQEDKATVLWEPTAQGYQARCSKPFGEKLDIPASFNSTLDTSGFEAPAQN